MQLCTFITTSCPPSPSFFRPSEGVASTHTHTSGMLSEGDTCINMHPSCTPTFVCMHVNVCLCARVFVCAHACNVHVLDGGGVLSPPVYDYLRSFFSFPQGLIKEHSSGGNCVFTVCVHPFPIYFAPVRDGVRCRPIFLPPSPTLPFVFHPHLALHARIMGERPYDVHACMCTC